MAERRMFAKSIMDSDDFMNLPFSAQAVYVHLAMRADDDGFIGNAKSILRMIGASEDDFRTLVDEGYLRTFDSSVVAIVHWKTHNYIQKDRYKPTVYRKEKDLMYPKKEEIKEETKEKVRKEETAEEKIEETAEEKIEENEDEKGTEITDDFFVSDLDTQDRIGKDRIGKVRSVKDRSVKDRSGKDRSDKVSADKEKQIGQQYADDSVCRMIMDFYNKTCYSLTPVTVLTEQRRKDISCLMRNHSHAEIQEVFRKAQQSDFLCGKGPRGWKASFDWLIKEDNFLKVSEGAYGKDCRTSEEAPPSYDLDAYEKHSMFDD